MFNRRWLTKGSVLVGALLVAMLITSTGPAMAQAVNNHARGNVVLRLRVDQNIVAAVGKPLNFEVAAANVGQADATNVDVAIPLDLGNLKLTGASFSNSQGFVTGIFPDPSINLLIAHYADTMESGEIVTGTFTFVPQPDAVGLSMRGTTSNSAIANAIGIFEDSQSGGVTISNRVDFTVGTDSQSDGTGDRVQTTDVAPNRTHPTNVNFVARNFAPGEKLSFWINFPHGSAADLGFIDYADPTGLYEVDGFDPNSVGLPAGNYSFVWHGNDSNVDYVAPFTVK